MTLQLQNLVPLTEPCLTIQLKMHLHVAYDIQKKNKIYAMMYADCGVSHLYTHI